MKTLFFDTETTGKAFFKLPHDHPSQPRIVSLAAILCDDLSEIGELNEVIRPDGFTIPEEASAIHGITTEFATASGITITSALELFRQLVAEAEICVAHNIQFDRLMIHREAGLGFFAGKKMFCTMEAMTPICNLPGPYGAKWPKLEEAYRHCFSREIIGAHGAMADAAACKEIYEWLHTAKTTNR